MLLERFLVRLSLSKHKEKFIFKGGLLLANYLDIGRETEDIDFSLTKLDAVIENIKAVIIDIYRVQVSDNFIFKWDKIGVLEQPHMEYRGYCVFLHVNFGELRDKIQIDIGIGDRISPRESVFLTLKYKGRPIFNDEIKLLMYPAEKIFAEKLETVISKGYANSRMKDYHDLLLMIRSTDFIDLEYLRKSIFDTFTDRNTPFQLPLSFDGEGLQVLQRLWNGHIRGLATHKDRLNMPDTLNVVIEEINVYLINLLPASWIN